MAAAVAAFDSDPEVARNALLEARTSSRAALQELRATVAVLRERSDTAPAPRLDQLAQLTQAPEAAGIAVAISDDRGGVELSGATELAAYRIVQESLTNVVRHGKASRVAVSLRGTGDALVVEIVDDGDPTGDRAGATARPGGFGLLGMTERARAVGGCIEYGPVTGGGWRVRAVLPAPPQP
jgi:signal transduction histidine kinase